MMISSLINYHSSNLTDSHKIRTKNIESIQNKAIRIILGCTSLTQTEYARSEVGLIGVEAEINEIAVLQMTRSLDTEDD